MPSADTASSPPSSRTSAHYRAFLRWLTFSDGVDTYTLGLWRSVDDVMNFVRSDAHRAAARAQRADGFEYSQFAGIWAAHSIGTRTLHCEDCQTAVTAPARECTSCGNPLEAGQHGHGELGRRHAAAPVPVARVG
jgi:hypothetical protein